MSKAMRRDRVDIELIGKHSEVVVNGTPISQLIAVDVSASVENPVAVVTLRFYADVRQKSTPSPEGE